MGLRYWGLIDGCGQTWAGPKMRSADGNEDSKPCTPGGYYFELSSNHHEFNLILEFGPKMLGPNPACTGKIFLASLENIGTEESERGQNYERGHGQRKFRRNFRSLVGNLRTFVVRHI